MKYLKKFDNHLNYEVFTLSEDYIEPNVSLCETENEIHYNPINYSKEYLTFVALEDGTFTFTPKKNNVINYSTDNGTTWTKGNSIEVNIGDKVMWKGTMTPSTSSPQQGIGTFSATGNYYILGNVMSLLFGDNYKEQTDLTGKNYTFYRLFYQSTKIVNTKNLSLPATTLSNYCYSQMFNGCTSLTTAPELPATTLASNCYNGMFWNCTNLVNTHILPATTLASNCYDSMFNGCTSLTTAPKLPATTLSNYCYNSMFRSCTSLVNVPELPATTLANGCYNSMFKGCTNLVTAPELPATTLATGCYMDMFNGCTSLNYIKAMFTTTPSNLDTQNWVKNVAASGTFVKNSAATCNVSALNGIPNGWTVETASE